ncbi:hypothetical protein INT44_006437 [Umbelopsis vinacea]|uniref:DUF7707 domain-containing protein n=1 Tax=Umbelopsis vinacea TaxID=44442 RepID=A0A8H7PTI2_9FUNG|nr:hypothetical protein INT44_006437 [Umbelopsis vinacea]
MQPIQISVNQKKMLLGSYTVLSSLALCFLSQVEAFNANDVDDRVKLNFPQWCNQQIATCPLICHDEFNQGASVNICDTASLAYECVCAGNKRPNVSEYTQTIHYFTCTYDQQSCVRACRIGDSSCTISCEQKYQCGAAHPRHNNSTILYPPIESDAKGNLSNRPDSRLAENLTPIGSGGKTFLSSSTSVHQTKAAGLAFVAVASLALFF